jgi:hypothetical protein
MGQAGPIALDYTPLMMRLDRMQLNQEEWELLYDDVRLLAATALTTMKAD